MENKKYEAVIRIADNGSITKTADEMGYTQSGVTQMLNSLESELGLTLFNRTNRGAVLTAEGEYMMPFFREEQIWEERIQQECAALKGVLSGEVRIGTLSSIGNAVLPYLLGTFNDRYPGVRVRADTMGDQEMSDALLSGEVDVIFIDMFEGSERPFLTRELFDDELLAVLPFGHPLAEKECVTLGELAEYPFLEVSSDGLVSNLKYVSDEERNLSWKIRFSLSDDLMLMNMIKNGMGVSFVGRMLTVNYPDKVVTRPLDPRKHRTFGIGVRSEKHLSPAVSAFIDTTDEVIADALEQI